MGYLKIPNLAADPSILMVREVYALEKIHGTSAHVSFKGDGAHFFGGGMSHPLFTSLFNAEELNSLKRARYSGLSMTLFGEAYGGKQQGMSLTYGKLPRFTVFDIQLDGRWLDVPQAEQAAKDLGLGFVFYARCATTQEALDAERDRPSTAAAQVGIDSTGEGVVLRPLTELMKADGSRLIAKYKRQDYAECASKADTGWPSVKQEEVLIGRMVAAEWVTPMRLDHVLQKVLVGDEALAPKHLSRIAEAMVEDVRAEAGDKVVWNEPARKFVAGAAVGLAKRRLGMK